MARLRVADSGDATSQMGRLHGANNEKKVKRSFSGSLSAAAQFRDGQDLLDVHLRVERSASSRQAASKQRLECLWFFFAFAELLRHQPSFAAHRSEVGIAGNRADRAPLKS